MNLVNGNIKCPFGINSNNVFPNPKINYEKPIFSDLITTPLK